MVMSLLEQINKSRDLNAAAARALIQTIGTVSRTVGYRLGRHLDQIIPLFLQYCGDAASEDEAQHSEAANELRESCFPGLESFVVKCPKEVASFLPNILKVSLAFMRYDPNYTFDEGQETMDVDGGVGQDGDEEVDEGGAEEEFDDYGCGSDDDDDTTWKVRKAALKVITAIIATSSSLSLHSASSSPSAAGAEVLRALVYQPWCVDAVIARFNRERDENVRLDVFQCVTSLVTTTQRLASKAASGVALSTAVDGISGSGGGVESELLQLLEIKVPLILHACTAQLVGHSVKSKSAVCALLRALAFALNVSHLLIITIHSRTDCASLLYLIIYRVGWRGTSRSSFP